MEEEETLQSSNLKRLRSGSVVIDAWTARHKCIFPIWYSACVLCACLVSIARCYGIRLNVYRLLLSAIRLALQSLLRGGFTRASLPLPLSLPLPTCPLAAVCGL